MHLILTHEQADFDALASLLGAYLLDNAALPVLPNRMNRNVRAFITLYGMDLPFVERRDLPPETVEAVTLVDAQSMVSIKGMGVNTRVHVIDHHPLRGGTPPNWIVTTEETGANTTLFVELLQGQDFPLSTIQATLLLMGIYEDTGSLTYTRTTARDIRAVAHLLDLGASLRIAVDFLNHPLSNRQHVLYDQLRSTIKALPIHGHTVIIGTGDAEDMDEELSTVAHKLRDLLDPDALIVLIKTRGGIQLIARSTSDNIDVADIATHFGGGGHARAAAGLVRNRELQDVYAEMVQVLPEHIRPAVTVAQIMSRGPQILTPDTPAEEALIRMQRYGYEGYPVVKDGKVVGLLTRRAVDRALSHKLSLTAASLMDAGEVTVQPSDSIQHLQHLMTDTGWGQIPVVQPESGQIIGIVTRTDLLKILTTNLKPSARPNLAERLDSALPPARLALLKAIAREAHEQHYALYIVGGFVRDLLLEHPSLDFDLVVEGDAILLARSLARQYKGRVTSHGRFGTAKWFIDKGNLSSWIHPLGESDPSSWDNNFEMPDFIDLVSARTEFYVAPSALPTVESGSIKLDLHRRDFTINTLALRLDSYHYGELHDYWGGLDDLRQEYVRCLHSLSFVDDPTRMLRAVRFEQRFNFKIEERTLQLLKEALPLIDRVSGDRVRHELDHILDDDHAAQMLSRLDKLGLLAAIHPDMKWDAWLSYCFEVLSQPGFGLAWELKEVDLSKNGGRVPLRRVLRYSIWLIRLPASRARKVVGRLKLPRLLTDQILEACKLRKDIGSLTNSPPSGVVARLDETPPLALAANYIAASDQDQKDMLNKYMTHWRYVHPSISGHDLVKRGLPRGAMYRSILRNLRAAWLDGKVTTREGEVEYLELLIREQANGE